MARDTTQQGDRTTDPAGARGQPLAMRHVGEHSQIPCGVTEINLFTNTVCFNIRLADAVGELPYFPEKNMHRKIIYTP